MVKKRKAPKPVDIIDLGPKSYRQLQLMNSAQVKGTTPEGMASLTMDLLENKPTSMYDAESQAHQEVSASSIGSDTTPWGSSFWDKPSANEEAFKHLGGIRAGNQPWYSKILNGTAKAGVLAVTTAAETAGLLYGIGQGTYNAANAEDGQGFEEFVHGIWDNPITRALKTINDASEEYMPNYYTEDERENPLALRNIFSANTLGDKLLKNTGFMVGAFYGGIPASAAVGKAGQAIVRSAKAAQELRHDLEGIKIAKAANKLGKETEAYNNWLKLNNLTDAERAKRYTDGLNKVLKVSKATRATSQAIGAFGSAVNEGAIEAINNSNDWAKMQYSKSRDELQQKQAAAAKKYQYMAAVIDQKYGKSEVKGSLLAAAKQEYTQDMLKAQKEYQTRNEAIEAGKTRMGDLDLLMNLPILMASNTYELGRLYSRGFQKNLTDVKGYLKGPLTDMKATKSIPKAIGKGLLKSNAEGMEEFFQQVASDAAGTTAENDVNTFLQHQRRPTIFQDANDYIANFGKQTIKGLKDDSYWDQYLVGFVSSLAGMPVFGSQTRNAYIGKGSKVGLAGGLVGAIQDENKMQESAKEIADYFRKRTKDPKFKALYENLQKHEELDKAIRNTLSKEDKKKYKDYDFDQIYNDISNAISAGRLSEFKELIKYNKEYTPEELADIVQNTSKVYTADQQKKDDMKRYNSINNDPAMKDADKAHEEVTKLEANLTRLRTSLDNLLSQRVVSVKDVNEIKKEIKKTEKDLKKAEKKASTADTLVKSLKKELAQVVGRINEDNYQDIRTGPFINASGDMDTQVDKDGVVGGDMIRILKKNQEHTLDIIDEVVRVRNDIDAETNGQLNSDQLATLAGLRMKMWDADMRSAEMAADIIGNILNAGFGSSDSEIKNLDTVSSTGILAAQERWREKENKDLEDAKKHLEDLKETKKAIQIILLWMLT